ncbi:toxin biosynthesis protein [Niveomyces insectorum RCEF 264]|uniref:Toxin biosynthesis protein n=1 Tax=Niveomyces insectorum RCEF 264 TaxID=1081102 RepID=A0A167XP54_9HYPO|nr:toxin biosynthesis protein [Niveomyces insectorum RCEF 264]
MSRPFFDVKEHVFDGQHIREYPRATAHAQEEVLRLCAKQYIPKSNPRPQPGDVSFVAAHANGFELYEPLWDDLLAAAAHHGFRIRSIWIADVAWQGQSGVLNEANLGNDPSWSDHARDLLHMVNVFRADLPRPLVGVGHSFGAAILTQVALMHPRLFTTMVYLDPVLHFNIGGPAFGDGPLERSAVRRDHWPSRAAAAAAFRRSPFYATWDPRVLDVWIAYGLRPLPADVPKAGGSSDGASDGSSNGSSDGPSDDGPKEGHSEQDCDTTTTTAAADSSPVGMLYRPEVPTITAQLPHLRPGVCYVFGGTSGLAEPAARRWCRTSATWCRWSGPGYASNALK